MNKGPKWSVPFIPMPDETFEALKDGVRIIPNRKCFRCGNAIIIPYDDDYPTTEAHTICAGSMRPEKKCDFWRFMRRGETL